MRIGDRGHSQTARPLSPPPDDVRPRARAAAARTADAGRPGSARTDSSSCARPTRRGSSCCASASRSTPTRPSSRAASATTRCSASRSAACTACGRCGGRRWRRALLRAICGQLIEARRAFAIERAILRAGRRPAPSARRSRRSLPRSSASSGWRPTAHRRSSASAARSTSKDCATRPDRSGRGAAPARARARALVARRRSRSKASAASATGSSATSASSSSAPRSGAAGSRPTRPPSCSRPTRSGRGSRALYLMRGWSAGLVPGANADLARLARCRAA